MYDEASKVASAVTGCDFEIMKRVEVNSTSKLEPALERKRSIATVRCCISFAAADAALSSQAKNRSHESTALLEEAMLDAEVSTLVLACDCNARFVAIVRNCRRKEEKFH